MSWEGYLLSIGINKSNLKGIQFSFTSVWVLFKCNLLEYNRHVKLHWTKNTYLQVCNFLYANKYFVPIKYIMVLHNGYLLYIFTLELDIFFLSFSLFLCFFLSCSLINLFWSNYFWLQSIWHIPHNYSSQANCIVTNPAISMWWGGGRKPDDSEETHAITGRTYWTPHGTPHGAVVPYITFKRPLHDIDSTCKLSTINSAFLYKKK